MNKELNEKNRIYWESREKKKLNKGLKDISKLERELKKEYKKAMDAISKEVAFFMSKFATDNNLSYDEANKLLNSKELKEFRMSVKEYVNLIELTGDDMLLLELNTLSMKNRISRLEQLYFQCDQIIDELSKTTNNSLQMLLSGTVKDNYYLTMYDMHKFMGVGYSFAKVNDKMIRDILSYAWSGRDYSSRIWSNRTKLKEALREEITQMIIQGKDLKATSRSLSNRMNASYKNCVRLIHTEHAYVSEQATIKAYTELDVDKYEILATLDKRTSPICQKLDGEVINVKDGIVGKNLPPFHP